MTTKSAKMNFRWPVGAQEYRTDSAAFVQVYLARFKLGVIGPGPTGP
jgi:hypothetical protein